MLTARDEDIDKIVGLEIGADDYLTKPFNPKELVARVKAILRRQKRSERSDDQPLHIGDVTIDPARREVHIGDEEVTLRTKEFDLLLTFAEHPGIVLTREQLLNLVWGFDFYGQTRTVDVHGGDGLGLAISRQIVEAHGGRLVAQSTLGKGSRFTVQLPIVQPYDETLVAQSN